MDWKWSCQWSKWSPSSTQSARFFSGQSSGRKRIFQPTVPRECHYHGKTGCSQSLGRGNHSLLFLNYFSMLEKMFSSGVSSNSLFLPLTTHLPISMVSATCGHPVGNCRLKASASRWYSVKGFCFCIFIYRRKMGKCRAQ